MPQLLTSKRGALFVVAVLLIVAATPSVYFYREYRKAQQRLANPTEYARMEARELVAKVGKLIDLPPTEEPTIATVSDAGKLKEQPFFAKAKNGDKILVFSSAKLVVLYDPTVNKVVNMGPLTLTSPVATSSAVSPTPVVKLTVVLRNGTTVVGLTKRFEEVIKEKAPELVVVDRENASKNTYEKSILIDVSGTHGEKAQALSRILGLPLEKLPEGESTPKTDFLIILGADQK